MPNATAMMWLRRDLRFGDNPALLDACAAAGGRVTGPFVLDPLLRARSGAGPYRTAARPGS